MIGATGVYGVPIDLPDKAGVARREGDAKLARCIGAAGHRSHHGRGATRRRGIVGDTGIIREGGPTGIIREGYREGPRTRRQVN